MREGGRSQERGKDNRSVKASVWGVDTEKGADTYALDGLTEQEIWLLNLTLFPSN